MKENLKATLYWALLWMWHKQSCSVLFVRTKLNTSENDANKYMNWVQYNVRLTGLYVTKSTVQFFTISRTRTDIIIKIPLKQTVIQILFYGDKIFIFIDSTFSNHNFADEILYKIYILFISLIMHKNMSKQYVLTSFAQWCCQKFWTFIYMILYTFK